MDFRSEFDSILKKYGHNILLQRAANVFQPSNPAYTNTTLELHTARHLYPNSQSLGFSEQEHLEGVRYDVDVVYYFRYDVNPNPKDRIYDNIEHFPDSYILFTVDWAAPMRGRGGELIFWTVGATKQTPK